MREYSFVDLFLLFGFLVSIKFLLIHSVPSTDFDVHRNWLAITFNLPLSEWYFDETSEWTFDYPPFFAYFEWTLAQTAALYDPSILVLSKEAIRSKNAILFQKFSVIVLDAVLFVGAAFASGFGVTDSEDQNRPKNVKWSQFLLLVCNVPLILLDNMHFQYNAFMYGILLMGCGFIFQKRFLTAAFLLSVLLNFKHIYLYFVPGFILFFSKAYLLPLNRLFVQKTIALALIVVIPVIVAFGPFAMHGGISGIHQIILRLFPFKRGLTHSYWAPNFWALYNAVDLASHKLGGSNSSIVPGYTSGNVQTYDHMRLPTITPVYTHILVLTSVATCLTLLTWRCRFAYKELFMNSIVLSAFSFFLFSWHVHEKAILLVQIPYTICVHQNPKFAPSYVLLSAASIVSQLPLIHIEPTENLFKYAVAIAYFLLIVFALNVYLELRISSLIRGKNLPFLIVLALVEIYKNLHYPIFGNRAAFLPLLMTSVTSAVVILNVFANFVYIIFICNGRAECEKKKN